MRVLKNTFKNILNRHGFKIIRIQDKQNVQLEKQNVHYYCRVLTGMSGYNFSINGDLSVSCSCQAHNGEGEIGRLNGANTLMAVFRGDKANKMRAMLASGELPVSICSRCPELRKAPKYVAEYYSKFYKMPASIMIENCSGCNYKCIYCPGKQGSARRVSTVISIEDMKYIANEVKANKINGIDFFKLGEPFLDKDILLKLQTLRETNTGISIRTSTNGLLIDNHEKIQAALLLDVITFSIDGVNTEMQNKYQRGADFEKIMENVKRIIKQRGALSRPLLIWKYVVFSWNDAAEDIKEAFKKAVEIGFDRLLFTAGGVGANDAQTKRYFMEDFIPEGIGYVLRTYEDGWGMEFDLSKKNGT